MFGDAIVGMVVMVVFFLSCMLLFDQELLEKKLWSGGLPMLVLGAFAGLVGGAWTGRDLRKQWAEEQRSATGTPSRTQPRDAFPARHARTDRRPLV